MLVSRVHFDVWSCGCWQTGHQLKVWNTRYDGIDMHHHQVHENCSNNREWCEYRFLIHVCCTLTFGACGYGSYPPDDVGQLLRAPLMLQNMAVKIHIFKRQIKLRTDWLLEMLVSKILSVPLTAVSNVIIPLLEVTRYTNVYHPEWCENIRAPAAGHGKITTWPTMPRICGEASVWLQPSACGGFSWRTSRVLVPGRAATEGLLSPAGYQQLIVQWYPMMNLVTLLVLLMVVILKFCSWLPYSFVAGYHY